MSAFAMSASGSTLPIEVPIGVGIMCLLVIFILALRH